MTTMVDLTQLGLPCRHAFELLGPSDNAQSPSVASFSKSERRLVDVLLLSCFMIRRQGKTLFGWADVFLLASVDDA